MIWARRVDANHGEIIAALRKAGCAVLDLSRVGHGCPDILVSIAQKNHLLELKSRDGELTDDQFKFRDYWRAPVHIVRSPEQALEAVGL